ncbi:trypsin-like serine peptidase [Nostoc sp. 'Peltigera membranacea cyanobiont' N6]|uniref:trypsin-like serine peptidase n=1 Tax=Nostoc sp. 'Peltigera membranacea cyanobiont' N6 TaxID=1261031 RepID=UPI0015E364B9|nr:serine protease [Nostoc sp. 'Peltigera membranacea cyanobiont' N6]
MSERVNLSSIPINRGQQQSLESIDPKDLVEIINSRFDVNPTSRINAVFGNPDFLPFSFLELGVRRGAAVCRIVRNFSEPFRQEIVNIVSEFEQELKDNNQDILTRQEIEEIFSMSEKEQGFVKDFFSNLAQASPSEVLQDPERFSKLLPIPVGTGFLVGNSYLLTNHHILPDEKLCHEIIAEFGYDQDGLGRKIPPIAYKLDTNPETGFFETNENLDYTLVKLQDKPVDPDLSILGRAGDHFGWITLDENSTRIAPPVDKTKIENLKLDGFDIKIPQSKSLEGEPVNIIQHPKGRRKQVILSSNRVTEIYKQFIRYQADADFSSSGSPVFNQQWQLVALHHAAVEDINDSKTMFEITAEEGVRTCEIVKDLKVKKEQYDPEVDSITEQKSNPKSQKIQTFITNFVDTVEKKAETNSTYPAPTYT